MSHWLGMSISMKHAIKILIIFAVWMAVLAACTMLPAESTEFNQAVVNQSDQPVGNPGSEQPANQPAGMEPTPYDAATQRAAEAIFIAAPGPQSGVVSPLVVEGIADSSLGSAVTVQLFQMSETGNPYDGLLAEQVVSIQPQMGSTGPFQIELTFTPQTGNPVGWVAVSISDPNSGALMQVSTAQVTLLASGNAQITLPEQSAETIQIDAPVAGQVVIGGDVSIVGYSEYFFEANVGVMLCAVGGDTSGAPHAICGTSTQVIAQGNLMIDSPDMGLPGPFDGSIRYQVDTETPARLVVYALSPRDGSILHLSSVGVTLQP